MKQNVILMSTYRRTLQMLLLLLLASFAAFGFTASVFEYLTVRLETARLGEYYEYVGVLLPVDPIESDVTDGALYLADNPYIDYADWRRVATGMLPEGMTNADNDGLSGDLLNEDYEVLVPYYKDFEDMLRHELTYLNDVVFYGTVESREFRTVFSIRGWTEDQVEAFRKAVDEDIWEESRWANEEVEILTLAVDQILEGRMWWFSKGGKLATVRVPRSPLGEKGIGIEEQEVTSQSASSSEPITPVSETIISTEELETYPFLGLQVGERYLLRARFQGLMGTLCFIPLQPEGPPYLAVTEGVVDLSTDEFNKLKTDMTLLHANLRCMTLLSTRDMHAMPEKWEGRRQISLDEGRWLTKEDDANEQAVCMIHQDFARAKGFSVGDMMSLQLWDSRERGGLHVSTESESFETDEGLMSIGSGMSYTGKYDGYMHAVDFETASIAPDLLELEIVGIYSRRSLMGSETTSDSNVIFIPEFCMPAEFGGETLTNTEVFLYSFVLCSYRDKDAFIEETRDPLAQMGLSVSFLDSNAEAFWGVMESLGESKLFSLCIYSLLLMMALVLVVFLYLRPRRKEFAVLRTLGLPRIKAWHALGLPIALIGAAGIAAGGVFGWQYALAQAAKTLSDFLQEGMDEFIPLSSVWMMAICLGAFAVLLIFVYVGIAMISRKSVLQLLHGGGASPYDKRR